MKDKILKVLNFLRIVDENALLSLTNIAVIVVIVKLAIAKELDFAAVAALLTAISGYGFKRFVHKDKAKDPGKDIAEKVAELEDKVGTIGLAHGFKRSR